MRFFSLVWASLLRRKTRTFLTLLSIVTAFLLFGFLDAVRVVFTQGSAQAGVDRLITTSRISFIQPLPLAYRERILAVPGVATLAHANWFGGIYQDRRNFFANIAVSPAEYLAIHPEIALSDGAYEAFLSRRTGALVGRELARKHGWAIGDRIPLQATLWPHKSGSTTWTFEIVGLMQASDERARKFENQMLFRYDYFDEGRMSGQGTAGWYIVKVRDPAESTRVALAIDALFRNSAAETRSQSEKEFNLAFARQFGDVGLIARAIMAAVFFTLLLVTGHTMAQGVRERTAELAVLKTLGFDNGLILRLVLAESMLMVLIGGLTGLSLASLTLPLFKTFGAQLPPLRIAAESWVAGFGIMLGLGLVVGLPPAVRAMRLGITEALAER